MLQALRRSANVSNILTLTAVAASGGAQGQTITRHVLIQGVHTVEEADDAGEAGEAEGQAEAEAEVQGPQVESAP